MRRSKYITTLSRQNFIILPRQKARTSSTIFLTINSKRSSNRIFFTLFILLIPRERILFRYALGQSGNAYAASSRYKYPLGDRSIRASISSSVPCAGRQSRGTTPRRWKRSRKTFLSGQQLAVIVDCVRERGRYRERSEGKRRRWRERGRPTHVDSSSIMQGRRVNWLKIKLL